MHKNLGQHLYLLGICSLVFTLVMVAIGRFPPTVLPQFLATGVIFLVAGRQMRTDPDKDRKAPRRRRFRHEYDWPWLSSLLNWTCALLLLGILAIAIAKPVGVSLRETINYTEAHEQFFAGAVP